MPETPGDAQLVPKENIPKLAELYDRFAQALDPFDPSNIQAESDFLLEIAGWYDNLPPPKPSLREFQKGIIKRCRAHLQATKHYPAV
jgi:hypothetical protein